MLPVMSEVDNQSAYRAANDAFNRGDVEGLLSHVDPELEWHEAEHLFDRGVYRGHDGLRRLVRENEELFGDLKADIDETFDGGSDLVVVLGHFNGGIGGIRVRIRFVHVCRFRDGRLVHLREYEDAGSVTDAITAVGLGGGSTAS
jgi:uncharacterized protein